MELMIYVARKGYKNIYRREIKDAKELENKEFIFTLNESLCFFVNCNCNLIW